MREGLACRCGRGTLYDVLQVSPWCEPGVIQAAYRALARACHPDLNRDADAEEQMRRLNVAYQTLSHPSRRARYDEELTLEAARPVAASAGPANGHIANGFGTNGHGARNAASGPRPAGAPGSRPAASASASAAMASSAAGPAPAYQAAVFGARDELLLPRSAIYASLVIVTVIVALVAWLVLDTMAERSSVPARLQRGYEELRAGPVVATTRPAEPLGASVEPGLSLPEERWNQ
jgi:hypothetical protein